MKTGVLFCFVLAMSWAIDSRAQDQPNGEDHPAELAKKLANPVASLISMPLQNDLDVGIGTHNGSRNTLNIQPVIPIKITSTINLITRVVLPVIFQQNTTSENTTQSGLADALVSAFFSPLEARNGLVWGAGPALLVPTATNDVLGTKKFGVGPTGLLLRQANGWTIGALVNQIWSVAGDADRNDVNQMFLQPFVVYNWKSGAGLGLNSEITQNWEGRNTTAFINPTISGVTMLGKQIVSLAIGPRIQVAAPDNGKANFGIRAQVTFVFPKRVNTRLDNSSSWRTKEVIKAVGYKPPANFFHSSRFR